MLEYLIGIKADGKQAEAESSRVARGFAGIENAAQRLAPLMLRVFSLYGVSRAIHAVFEMTSKLDSLSVQAGVSTTKLQEWNAALAGTPVTIDDLVNNMRALKIATTEALANPKSDVIAAFGRFGLSVRDLNGMRPEQIFDRIAAAMQKLPATAQTTADLVKLLGRNAEALVPAFKAGFAAAAQGAHAAGMIIAKEDIDAIQKLEKAMGRLKTQALVSISKAVAGGGRGVDRTGIVQTAQEFIPLGDAIEKDGGLGKNWLGPIGWAWGIKSKWKAAKEVAQHTATISDAGEAAALSRSLRQRGTNVGSEAILGMMESESPTQQKQLEALRDLVKEVRDLKQVTKEAL